jgi:hypothetical protein
LSQKELNEETREELSRLKAAVKEYDKQQRKEQLHN